MRCCIARIPGCDRECNESNTCLRNCAGTNGREVPVEMSQRRVMVDPGNGTAMRFSEDDGWDFHCWSSGSVCWALAKDWKSMGSCAWDALTSS